jgi:tetratricopeptide (TPR) repeat protein
MWLATQRSIQGRAKMLTLAKFEPTPDLTKQLRQVAETSVAIVPDAYELSKLAWVLVSDYLNRWNEAENDINGGRQLLLEAEQRVQQALAIANTLDAAHYAKAFILRAQGKFLDAQKTFADLTARYPRWGSAFAQEGNEWVNLGPGNTFANFDTALDRASTAIGLNSSNGVFYWVRGRAYFFKKDYGSAITALEESRRLRDNLWFNRLYLVSAYARNGQDATNELMDFRRQFPDFTPQIVDMYERDLANPNLDLCDFHLGLYEAKFLPTPPPPPP